MLEHLPPVDLHDVRKEALEFRQGPNIHIASLTRVETMDWRRVVMPDGGDVTPHFHTESDEFFLFHLGGGKIFRGRPERREEVWAVKNWDEGTPIRPGLLIPMPRAIAHYIVAEGELSLDFIHSGGEQHLKHFSEGGHWTPVENKPNVG